MKYARGIDHVAIAVGDLETTIHWFTAILGFTVKERRETDGITTGMISPVLEAGPITLCYCRELQQSLKSPGS
jgi:methylmalonyl-CoA/ethylmalonyl-CoA epimerase